MVTEKMNLKFLKQILKTLADDTRLRIINLLNNEELTVSDICSILDLNQPAVSKQMVRLRLSKIVADRRDGNFIYYGLNKNIESEEWKVIEFLLSKFGSLETFKNDLQNLQKLKEANE